MHAFENPANFVTEGLLSFLVSQTDQAKRLRREAIIYIVPMMDVDAVIRGSTGKDQSPVDFNRDWIAPTHNSHWNAVVAAKSLITSSAAANELSLYIDMHSVSPVDPNNFIFVYNDAQQNILGQNFTDRLTVNGGFPYPNTLYTNAIFDPAVSQDYILQFHNTPSLLSITPETTFNFTSTGALWTINNLIDQGEYFGQACSDYINGKNKPNQLVVDNSNIGQTSSTGTWTASTNFQGYYATDYLFAASNSNATYTFQLSSLPAAEYGVSLFYSSDINRANNIQGTLALPNGNRNYTINQEIIGGQWLHLDTVTLANNTAVSFTLDANNTNGHVAADAFRLYPITEICVPNKNYTLGIDDFYNSQNIHQKVEFVITANNIIGNGSQVIYSAGDCIELNNSFEVQLGALFEARIQGCTN